MFNPSPFENVETRLLFWRRADDSPAERVYTLDERVFRSPEC